MALQNSQSVLRDPNLTPRQNESFVIKRNGNHEVVRVDKITERLRILCTMYPPLSEELDPFIITQKVMCSFCSGMTTAEIDTLATETAVYLQTQHPDYYTLGSRLLVSNSHKMIGTRWIDVITRIKNHQNESNSSANSTDGKDFVPSISRLSKEFINLVEKHHAVLEKVFRIERDYQKDYFAYSTIARSYLYRINDTVSETPQQLFMRVGLFLYKDDLANVKTTYTYLSKGYYTHATPTMANAGKEVHQLSSCYLIAGENTVESVYLKTAYAAILSSTNGGIGFDISAISPAISGRRGILLTEVVPDPHMFTGFLGNTIKTLDDMPINITQGTSGRKAAIVINAVIYHAAIPTLLEAKAMDSKSSHVRKLRNLFLKLMIHDLFMQRIKERGKWSLFYPDTVPGLHKLHGKEFEKKYEEYEKTGIAYACVDALKLWEKIIGTQIPSGMPFMLYKDTINSKNNQSNLGTIRTSNLCTEIMEYTSDSEIAVCNLATICLSAMVTRDKEREEKEQSERELYKFNFPRFRRVTSHVIKSLNKVLDTNYYPVEIAGKSNAKHRPIGLGVQGLADAFMMLRIPFESKEAAILNIDIFEVMYYEAMKQSCELAKEQGPYASFSGSPISEGKFQFDLWGVSPSYRQVTLEEWNTLRTDIMKHGIVNSLLITLPPTATTSAACGNYECTEPPTSNQYIRRTLAGEFIVVNKHLLKDLLALGLWDTKMQQDLIRYYGSVQSIDRIPAELKKLYKTVWEISQKTIIDLAADRGPFICQSQSMNIHIAEPTTAQMHQMHFYGWERGLKTGMYYLRTQPNVKPIQATLLDTNQAKPHEVSSSLSDNTKPKSIRSMDPLIGEIAQQSLITERFLIGSELGSACTNGACDA